MAFTEHRSNGVPWLRADALPCPHAFTTRLGGVSAGPYASLNLGERTGDDPAAVRENYRRLQRALGFGEKGMVFTRQVHGAEVRVVTEADRRLPLEGDRPVCDGLVTNVRGLPLIIFTADCIPVLLCDPEAGVAGAVHCGWRSTVLDILGVAVRKMTALGARPERLRAAIGPGIGACCYETGAEVKQALRDWLPGGGEFCRPLGETKAAPGTVGAVAAKYMVDLRGADRAYLMRLGLREENIDVSGACTKCESDRYWSHRVTGKTRGSQAAVVMLD